MLAKRIIPCLDVDAGRVVKGVRFRDLRDAGDPVELAARYDADGADELVFLDITATVEGRDAMDDVIARTAEQVFIPLTVGGGVREPDDVRRAAPRRRRQGRVQQRRGPRPRAAAHAAADTYGAQCMVIAIDAARRDGRLGGVRRCGTNADRTRRGRVGRRGDRQARRRRDPAHLDGPRRHRRGLRPRAARGRARRDQRAADRERRGRHARAFRRRAAPGRRRSWPPAASTTATSRSARSKDHLAAEGIPVRR